MPDELDRNFVNKDDAKAEIRAAVEYLLRGAPAAARGDIVREIIEIEREVAKWRAAKSSGRWHAWRLSAHPPPVRQICFVSCLCSEETDWISDACPRMKIPRLKRLAIRIVHGARHLHRY